MDAIDRQEAGGSRKSGAMLSFKDASVHHIYNMCRYTLIYTSVYIYMHTYYICVYIHIHTCVCLYSTYICTYMYVDIHAVFRVSILPLSLRRLRLEGHGTSHRVGNSISKTVKTQTPGRIQKVGPPILGPTTAIV